METNLQRWCRPETILVATNLRESASVMLHAVHQALFAHAKVILAHVILPSCLRTGSHSDAPAVLPCSAEQSARMRLNELALQFQAEGVPCEPVLLEGDVTDQIELLANSRQVDRVIVAAGRTIGIERFLIRSIPEALACRVNAPLCTICPNATSGARMMGHFRHLLIAISADCEDFQSIQFGAALAEAHGASLTLLHVLNATGAPNLSSASTLPYQAAALLSKCSHSCNRNLITRNGDFALHTLTTAARESPDLIVLGAPADSVIARLLGTTAIHRIIQEAKCPVVTIKRSTLRVRAAIEGSHYQMPDTVPAGSTLMARGSSE